MALVRWGILGTGSVAERFATGLSQFEAAHLVAVGSRTADRAESFGKRFDVPNRHSSYESLTDDTDVDVVYIATPHTLHKPHTLLALNSGKPVLCEKPLAVDAAEAREVVEAARASRLFLMEGMWTRFFPLVVRLRSMLQDGEIGEVRMISAWYGFQATKPRMFDPALGGGAALDIGVYPLSLASMILGRPSEVTALADFTAQGIDQQLGFALKYEGGQIVTAALSISGSIAPEALIVGTEGTIRLHPPFNCPSRMTLTRADGDEVIEMPYQGNGFPHEAAEVMACLEAGRQESAVMPLDESIEILEVLDEIRLQSHRRRRSEQRAR